MVLCGTGHRPHKLGGYGPDVERRLLELVRRALEELAPARVISGMALGFDQALARAALDSGIPLVAAIPCRGQDERWPEPARRRYAEILRGAVEVVHVTDAPYSPRAMHARNAWMVEHATRVLALWDGSLGGTAACVRLARHRDRPIDNLWTRWQALTHAPPQA